MADPKKYFRDRIAWAKAHGMCRSCNTPIGTKSTIYCDKHHDMATAARRRREGSKPRPPKKAKPVVVQVPQPEKTKSGQAPINYGLLTTMKERSEDPWRCLALDILTVSVLDHNRGECEPEWWSSEIFELCCDAIGWHPDYIKRHMGVNNAAKEATSSQ